MVGPAAAEALAKIGLDELPDVAGGWLRSGDLVILKQEEFDLPGYDLLVPSDQGADVLERLAPTILDDPTYTARRIELGRPASGAELTGEYSPLEASLAWACAENKGCYTGQEIIARQITYDKVTRSLAGLRSDALLTPGAAVMIEGRSIGQITSAAFSPALQMPIALAILKRPHHLPGTAVTVDGIAAIVTLFPMA
jgi:folate-binding protein YgfZ